MTPPVDSTLNSEAQMWRELWVKEQQMFYMDMIVRAFKASMSLLKANNNLTAQNSSSKKGKNLTALIVFVLIKPGKENKAKMVNLRESGGEMRAGRVGVEI